MCLLSLKVCNLFRAKLAPNVLATGLDALVLLANRSPVSMEYGNSV